MNVGRSHFGLRNPLQLPAGARFAAKESIGSSRVRHPQVGAVPHNLLAGAVGNVTKMVRLGQQSCVAIERAAGRRAVFAGQQPLLLMAGRSDDRLLGPLEVLEFGLRQQVWVP
jgi:hypothetical protein